MSTRLSLLAICTFGDLSVVGRNISKSVIRPVGAARDTNHHRRFAKMVQTVSVGARF